MTLDMLRHSRINPRLSAHTQIFVVSDYNRTPLAPIGTRTVVHERPAQKGRTTFGDHGVIGWTTGPALDHYRHWDFYIPKTTGTRGSDTVVFLPEKYSMPTTASADRAAAALEELTEALKNPAATKPFLNTGSKLDTAIEALTEILSTNRNTTPPNSGASPPRVSERTVQPPRVNNARAAVPTVNPTQAISTGVDNDPNLALRPKINPQVAVRSLNKIISKRATTILNSTNNIKQATSIPTKLVNNNNNINDTNNINGVDNVTPGEENSEENSPKRQLLKRVSPKTQKLKLNTTVYKIFEDKIHTGYICKFDSKDGFYKIKYQDGDIEEGTEEEISRLLKKPNQTAWKQALSATIFERVHAQYCKTEERMPIPSIFSNGYGKAVAILEYQGGNDAFIPDQQDYKYRACAVIDEETGKLMEYRDMLKDPKHRET
jgi:hypothetical protein